MAERMIGGRAPIVMTLEPGTYWWCACGRSKMQPFCDGSHEGTGFEPKEFTITESRRVSLCTCKLTRNPPMCDGSHKSLPPLESDAPPAATTTTGATAAATQTAPVDFLDAPPTLLVLCSDLIFITKITSTAKSLQRPFGVARTIDKLNSLLAAAASRPLLIVDLNITGLDPIAAITAAKAHPNAPHILAFLSHVQTDLAEAAKKAGADQVMPRSAFSAQLPQLLSIPA
jgi:CDGSH-type Zn-finger protein